MRNSTPLFFSELCACLEPGAQLPSGGELARILSQIAECEIEEGGPYSSDPGSAQDGASGIDLGLNLAIALFLRRLNVRLPKLEAYIKDTLEKELPVSKLIGTNQLADFIARYHLREINSPPRARPPVWSEQELSALTQMRDRMEWRFTGLSKELAHHARDVVERTIKGNPDKQMSLMPLFMRQALGKRGWQFDDYTLSELSLANVFFWTAFIIYDDFWDEDEAAEPKYLPVANLLARHYAGFFTTYAASTSFSRIYGELMDKLDAANEWEILTCRMRREGNTIFVPHTLPRYGDFGIKFYPAAGHALGPIGMLLQLGYADTSDEVEWALAYFKHYLIAMQLNDDAHDWKEDLSRGHISTAVSLLLAAWKDSHPGQDEIDLERDLPELERLFWFETLQPLCESIFSHTRNAQAALDALVEAGCVENPAPLQQFIDRNNEAALKAQEEYLKSIAFLKTIETLEKTQINTRRI